MTHRLVLALLLAMPLPLAASPTGPAVPDPALMRIVLLDRFYRIEDLQFDRLDLVLKHIDAARPPGIRLEVCPVTRKSQVDAVQGAIIKRFSGPLLQKTLEKRALECSWDAWRPLPRST